MIPGGAKRNLTQRASVHLDMARGLAALAVLMNHVRGLFFIPYHDVSHHSIILDAFYGATTLGHQAVMVFFVLSGFLIVSSIVQSFEGGRWSWTKYLVNRIVRLNLVLIPALILCWVMDHTGMALPSTAALYYRPVQNLFTTSVAHLETAPNFFGSLFYVQGILVRPFGSDGPLWSLSYEFWYYILFPVVLCALASRFRGRIRALYCVAAILILLFVGRAIALYFLIWLLGGMLAISLRFCAARARFAWANAMGVAPLLLVLGFSVSRPLNFPFFTDAIVALGFASWVYVIVGAPERHISPAYAKTARLLASFSYTLYLTHFPIVFFLRARMHSAVWQPTFTHFVYAALICALAVLIAYGFAQMTEARTELVRKRVMGLFQ